MFSHSLVQDWADKLSHLASETVVKVKGVVLARPSYGINKVFFCLCICLFSFSLRVWLDCLPLTYMLMYV